jgi:hypothetical protein
MTSSDFKAQTLLSAARQAAEPRAADYERIRNRVRQSAALVATGASAALVATGASAAMLGGVAESAGATGLGAQASSAADAGSTASAAAGSAKVAVAAHASAMKWLGIALLVGAPAFVGGLVVGGHSSDGAAESQEARDTTRLEVNAVPEQSLVEVPAPAPLTAPMLAPEAATEKPKGRTAEAPRTPAPATEEETSGSHPDTLGSELSMLSRARRAQRLGNAPLALGIVQDLEKRHPDGALLEESEIIAITALCTAERFDEAQQRIARFLEKYPSSLHVPRLRQGCPDTKPDPGGD